MSELYCGGTIVPMTAEGCSPEAVVVNDRGRISFVGSLDEARQADPRAAEVDLQGHALLPGFVDPHSHFLMADTMVTQADLSPCTSFAGIQGALRSFIEANGIGPEGVVLGRGYDHNDLDERRHPDKFVLDAVSLEVPIYISHASGHMGVANSKALELAGIRREQPDPDGGRYGRVGLTMEVDGYCEELTALEPVVTKLTARAKVDRPAVVRQVQDIYLSNGITTCQDGASLELFLDGFMGLLDTGILDLDVVGYPLFTMGQEKVRARYPQYFGQGYINRFRFGGLKLLLDGSPQGRTAWMSEPYEPDESGKADWCAYPSLADDVVTACAKEAIDNGFQLLAHCNGDAASEQLLRCYKAAYDASDNPGKAALRPVMIHCQTARRDQYERMGALNMIPSIFTSHIWYWGDVHLKNLGARRGSRISAVHDALECGLIYNFHTDAPIVPPDMLLTVWCAVNRLTKHGAQLDERQKVGAFDAMKAITSNAAYAYGEEGRKGTIEVGKLADLVVLDRSPLTVDPMEIRDVRVLATIKEGRAVWTR